MNIESKTYRHENICNNLTKVTLFRFLTNNLRDLHVNTLKHLTHYRKNRAEKIYLVVSECTDKMFLYETLIGQAKYQHHKTLTF